MNHTSRFSRSMSLTCAKQRQLRRQALGSQGPAGVDAAFAEVMLTAALLAVRRRRDGSRLRISLTGVICHMACSRPSSSRLISRAMSGGRSTRIEASAGFRLNIDDVRKRTFLKQTGDHRRLFSINIQCFEQEVFC